MTDTNLDPYIVAPGHTVDTDEGSHGPSATVLLSPDEGARLRLQGFLLEEDGSHTIANGNAGPPFNVEDGVAIEAGPS